MKNKQAKGKKGLSDAELVAKYEAGQQPVIKILKKMLSKPNVATAAKRAS